MKTINAPWIIYFVKYIHKYGLTNRINLLFILSFTETGQKRYFTISKIIFLPRWRFLHFSVSTSSNPIRANFGLTMNEYHRTSPAVILVLYYFLKCLFQEIKLSFFKYEVKMGVLWMRAGSKNWEALSNGKYRTERKWHYANQIEERMLLFDSKSYSYQRSLLYRNIPPTNEMT